MFREISDDAVGDECLSVMPRHLGCFGIDRQSRFLSFCKPLLFLHLDPLGFTSGYVFYSNASQTPTQPWARSMQPRLVLTLPASAKKGFMHDVHLDFLS